MSGVDESLGIIVGIDLDTHDEESFYLHNDDEIGPIESYLKQKGYVTRIITPTDVSYQKWSQNAKQFIPTSEQGECLLDTPIKSNVSSNSKTKSGRNVKFNIGSTCDSDESEGSNWSTSSELSSVTAYSRKQKAQTQSKREQHVSSRDTSSQAKASMSSQAPHSLHSPSSIKVSSQAQQQRRKSSNLSKQSQLRTSQSRHLFRGNRSDNNGIQNNTTRRRAAEGSATISSDSPSSPLSPGTQTLDFLSKLGASAELVIANLSSTEKTSALKDDSLEAKFPPAPASTDLSDGDSTSLVPIIEFVANHGQGPVIYHCVESRLSGAIHTFSALPGYTGPNLKNLKSLLRYVQISSNDKLYSNSNRGKPFQDQGGKGLLLRKRMGSLGVLENGWVENNRAALDARKEFIDSLYQTVEDNVGHVPPFVDGPEWIREFMLDCQSEHNQIQGRPGERWVSTRGYNPFGKFGHEPGDVVIMSPFESESQRDILALFHQGPDGGMPKRFLPNPLEQHSPYLRTHELHPTILELNTDSCGQRPWGFEVRHHEFGGGCLVSSVELCSPAAAATNFVTRRVDGLRPYDLVLMFNGQSVSSMTEMEFRVGIESIVPTLTLTISRCIITTEWMQQQELDWYDPIAGKVSPGTASSTTPSLSYDSSAKANALSAMTPSTTSSFSCASSAKTPSMSEVQEVLGAIGGNGDSSSIVADQNAIFNSITESSASTVIASSATGSSATGSSATRSSSLSAKSPGKLEWSPMASALQSKAIGTEKRILESIAKFERWSVENGGRMNPKLLPRHRVKSRRSCTFDDECNIYEILHSQKSKYWTGKSDKDKNIFLKSLTGVALLQMGYDPRVAWKDNDIAMPGVSISFIKSKVTGSRLILPTTIDVLTRPLSNSEKDTLVRFRDMNEQDIGDDTVIAVAYLDNIGKVGDKRVTLQAKSTRKLLHNPPYPWSPEQRRKQDISDLYLDDNLSGFLAHLLNHDNIGRGMMVAVMNSHFYTELASRGPARVFNWCEKATGVPFRALNKIVTYIHSASARHFKVAITDLQSGSLTLFDNICSERNMDKLQEEAKIIAVHMTRFICAKREYENGCVRRYSNRNASQKTQDHQNHPRKYAIKRPLTHCVGRCPTQQNGWDCLLLCTLTIIAEINNTTIDIEISSEELNNVRDRITLIINQFLVKEVEEQGNTSDDDDDEAEHVPASTITTYMSPYNKYISKDACAGLGCGYCGPGVSRECRRRKACYLCLKKMDAYANEEAIVAQTNDAHDYCCHTRGKRGKDTNYQIGKDPLIELKILLLTMCKEDDDPANLREATMDLKNTMLFHNNWVKCFHPNEVDALQRFEASQAFIDEWVTQWNTGKRDVDDYLDWVEPSCSPPVPLKVAAEYCKLCQDEYSSKVKKGGGYLHDPICPRNNTCKACSLVMDEKDNISFSKQRLGRTKHHELCPNASNKLTFATGEAAAAHQLSQAPRPGRTEDLIEVGPGWKVNIIERVGGGKNDYYYFSPTGERFGILKQAKAAHDKGSVQLGSDGKPPARSGRRAATAKKPKYTYDSDEVEVEGIDDDSEDETPMPATARGKKKTQSSGSATKPKRKKNNENTDKISDVFTKKQRTAKNEPAKNKREPAEKKAPKKSVNKPKKKAKKRKSKHDTQTATDGNTVNNQAEVEESALPEGFKSSGHWYIGGRVRYKLTKDDTDEQSMAGTVLLGRVAAFAPDNIDDPFQCSVTKQPTEMFRVIFDSNEYLNSKDLEEFELDWVYEDGVPTHSGLKTHNGFDLVPYVKGAHGKVIDCLRQGEWTFLLDMHTLLEQMMKNGDDGKITTSLLTDIQHPLRPNINDHDSYLFMTKNYGETDQLFQECVDKLFIDCGFEAGGESNDVEEVESATSEGNSIIMGVGRKDKNTIIPDAVVIGKLQETSNNHVLDICKGAIGNKEYQPFIIEFLAVRPGMQRQGIGKFLLQLVCTLYRYADFGPPKILLAANTKKNKAVCNWYKKIGFKQCEWRENSEYIQQYALNNEFMKQVEGRLSRKNEEKAIAELVGKEEWKPFVTRRFIE